MPLPKQKRATITEFLYPIMGPMQQAVRAIGRDAVGKSEQQVANGIIQKGIITPLSLKPHQASINPDTPNKVTVVWAFEGNRNLLDYATPDGRIPEKVDGLIFSETYEYPGSITDSTQLREEVATRIQTRTNFLTAYIADINKAVAEHNRELRETILALVTSRMKALNDAKATEDFLNKQH